MISEEKTCTRCKKSKSTDEFGKYHSPRYNVSGFQSMCKGCTAYLSNIRYHSNPAANLSQKKASAKWQAANLPKVYANQKRYRERLAAKNNTVLKTIPIYYAANIQAREEITQDSSIVQLDL